MLSWGMGVVLCILLIAGCGGGPRGLITETAPPLQTEVSSAYEPPEEPLTEELSAKRLEELYAKSGIPGMDPGLEEELKKWDHQTKFDTPIQADHRAVKAYLVYFSTERKEVIRRYLSRSSRYLPMIKGIFQEYGLPEDLAYLAMIESGFNSKAVSPAAACGMWQFIRGTGARYGLSMDSYVDERRDPEKSTKAAAKYLLDLYKQFGSWYLAAASYNCGEGRVQRELNQSSHKSFWDLSDNQCLPKETKNYVPQLIAATIIAKNPEKFGFKNVPYLPPLATDKVQVKEPTSLRAAAVAVNVPLEEIQALNPALLRGMTPPDGSYTLNLPANSKEAFAKNIMLASAENPPVASRGPRVVASRASRVERSHSEAVHHPQPAHYAASKAAPHKAAHNSHKLCYPAKPEKVEKKTRVAAAKHGKKGKIEVAAAKKGKSGHTATEKAATVHTASMFGFPSAAKSAAKEKGKTRAAAGEKKAKGKVAKEKSKKSSTQVARKSDKNTKSSVKHGSGRGKDKVSKNSRHMMYSEAR